MPLDEAIFRRFPSSRPHTEFTDSFDRLFNDAKPFQNLRFPGPYILEEIVCDHFKHFRGKEEQSIWNARVSTLCDADVEAPVTCCNRLPILCDEIRESEDDPIHHSSLRIFRGVT